MDLPNWLKRSPSVPSPLSQAPVSPEVTALGARVAELEAMLRDLTMLRLEWVEVLDKLAAWTNRQNARDAKRVKQGLSQLSQDAPGDTNDSEPAQEGPVTKAELRRRLSARFQHRAQGE